MNGPEMARMAGETPVASLLLGAGASEIARDVEQLLQSFPDTPLLAIVNRLDCLTVLPKSFSDLSDYLLHPFSDIDVILRVHRVIQQRQNSFNRTTRRLGKTTDITVPLLGDSEVFLKAKSLLNAVAKLDATCLIEGETGTGKELFARALHYLGARQASPFVPLNCGALPEHLIESELFGHVKGAYTDARSANEGLIRFAEDGTLFLDEIDALSPAAQVKLLRILQEGEYRAVGSTKMLHVQARIVAASNANLRERVRAGMFREDLFHRLNILRVTVPPLRERGEDVILLAEYFLERYGTPTMRLSDEAVLSLRQHDWPGNVRELQAAVQRAVLLSNGCIVEPEDLQLPEATTSTRAGSTAKDLVTAKLRVVGDFERTYLEGILRSHGGNVTHAAKAAGKDRRSFQRLLKKHQLSQPTRSKASA
jgi:DNA-binding NtrC family response regulator